MHLFSSHQSTGMDDSFDPVACANLHNELLRRATQHIANASDNFRRDLVQRTLQAIPEWTEIPDLENLPIFRFMSLLDCYQSESVPLTPEFRQPVPDWFRHPYLEDIDEGSEVAWTILLYPDNTCEPEMDSGLFFNLVTGTAAFTSIESVTSPLFKDGVPRHWLPLQTILQKALDMWQCGKFYQGPSWKDMDNDETLSISPWIPSDVDDAIHAWEDLIQAIHARLPPSLSGQSITWLDPLPERVFRDEYNISPFAKAFLLRARRPSLITSVAPGLTFFDTEDSLRRIYEHEDDDDDSPRRRWNRDNSSLPERYPSLILRSIQQGNKIPKPCPGNPGFDKPWGHAKFTVGRRPGLYTDPIYADHHADSVRLIAESGAADRVVGFGPPPPALGSRPWGTDRGPRLCEVLGRFADLVRDGTWDVSPQQRDHDADGIEGVGEGWGVTTPASWFTDRGTRGARTLEWTLDKR